MLDSYSGKKYNLMRFNVSDYRRSCYPEVKAFGQNGWVLIKYISLLIEPGWPAIFEKVAILMAFCPEVGPKVQLGE